MAAHLPPSVRQFLSPTARMDLEQWVRALVDEGVRALVDEPPRFMTPKHAARWLDCDVRRIYDLLNQRRLTKYREGGRVLVLRAEVAALVEMEGDHDW